MADGGLPAPQAPPTAPAPPAASPAPPTQPAALPVQPAAPQIRPGQIPQLNWSHFKPEFSGKPNEDAEAHLHMKNDWMDNHAFPEGVKVQRFCLTLVGEASLWCESLRPIAIDWNNL